MTAKHVLSITIIIVDVIFSAGTRYYVQYDVTWFVYKRERQDLNPPNCNMDSP